MRNLFVLCVVMLLALSWSCGQVGDTGPTTEEARAIAKEAFIYGFPMVVNYKTMYMYVIDENSPEYKGPFNFFGCEARLFTPEDKAVVTPNADTPYCMYWGDLRSEPQVIAVPEMEPERFYQFQLIDLYTHNFAYVGTLTSGNGAENYLVHGPDWQGETPEGISGVIPCETGFLFCVVRTQLFNPEDLERVAEIQAEYRFQPLSAYLGTDPPAAAPALDFPRWKEGDQFNTGALAYIDFMLSLVEPVEEEKALMERFARIGLGTDEDFDITRFEPDIRQALEEGVEKGFKEIEAFIAEKLRDPLASAKIFGTRDFLGESAAGNYNLSDIYLLRSAAAHMGLYGNSGAEAIYPAYLADSDGEPLNAAENSYTVTFGEGDLPPVKAFWSLTMYDGRTQLFIHNPLNRYLLSSTSLDQFVREEDGSIVFHIQQDSPGKELEANWLPAADGPFYMIMRLYGPEPDALKGTWTPPVAMKQD